MELVRPMLRIYKNEVISYCHEHQLHFFGTVVTIPANISAIKCAWMYFLFFLPIMNIFPRL
ncbi:hypothetical protein P7H17_09100 [Paenibacillus larvae]|nr:hypothetical protein [Paenibacillus larvae]MDT2286205.1 hypothetical protein [Paenibacillus larvae]